MSAGGLYGYLMSSLVTLIPIYLDKDLGIKKTEIGIIITAVIIGTLRARCLSGGRQIAFGKRRTLLVCSIVMSIVFALMAFHHDWRLFIVTGAVLGAVAGSLYPIGLAIIGGIVSRERLGAATSMFSLAFGLGSLIGPSASGFAMTHLGDRWLFYIPSILSALFALEMIVLYKRIASRKKMDIQEAGR